MGGGDLHSFVLGKGRGRRQEVGRARRARVGSCRGGEARGWGGVEGQRFRRLWGGVSLCEDEPSRGGGTCRAGHTMRMAPPFAEPRWCPPPPPSPQPSAAERGPGAERSAMPRSPALGRQQRHARSLALPTPSLGFRVRPDHCPRLPHPGHIVPFYRGKGGKVG